MTVKFQDFEKLDLKVGEILGADDVPGADKLYRLEVDIGGRQITLVAGIKQNYRKEDLKGKKIVVLTNLQPATIKGITSEGMLLAAVKGDKVKLVTVDGDMEVGSDVA